MIWLLWAIIAKGGCRGELNWEEGPKSKKGQELIIDNCDYCCCRLLLL